MIRDRLMARIVFTSLGSLGDLYPMLPIAARLVHAGHHVSFVVPTPLAATVIEEGFECRPVELPVYGASDPSTSPSAVRRQIHERLPSLLSATLAVLRKACQSADTLITHPHQLAAAMTARKLDLSWITLTVYPGLIPSGYTVPEPHWLPALPTPLGRAINRFTWRTFRFALRHLSGDIISEALVNEGLAPDDDLFMPGGLSPHLTLVVSSPHYSPPQPDWPPHVKLTGYTAWDEPRGWTEPPELGTFFGRGEPPVLVTTSSAGERDAASFFRQSVTALRLAGKRGLLLLGRASKEMNVRPGQEIEPGIAAWPYLPLSRVVGRCCLVVHHGGVGTSLTTIRHGRAAVAVPAVFDQWYNARRIERLGVGRVLEWNSLTAKRLAADMTAVLNRPAYTARSREIGEAMAKEDGAGRSREEIEALLGIRGS